MITMGDIKFFGGTGWVIAVDIRLKNFPNLVNILGKAIPFSIFFIPIHSVHPNFVLCSYIYRNNNHETGICNRY